MSTNEERRKIRQRVALHRLRKEEEKEIKKEQEVAIQERKEVRAELVQRYGEDRVANVEWSHCAMQAARILKDFFAAKADTRLCEAPCNAENVLEYLDYIESWAKYYEPDPVMDDSWQRGMRLGLFPQPQGAVTYFNNLYQKYLSKAGT